MRIDVITVLPELMQSPLQHSILQRAQQKKLLEVNIIPLRPFGKGPHQQLDDYQFGGGAGMVMMPEPLGECIEHCQSSIQYDEIIFLTPDGDRLTQSMANALSLKSNLLLIAGHYKGIDQRIRDTYITKEISIGDYVLSGGEIPALVLIDAIGRILPGVLGDESSALFDSFQDQLLSCPVYTRPAIWKGQQVPEVLLNGNAAAIEEWRYQQALEHTRIKRPELLTGDEDEA